MRIPTLLVTTALLLGGCARRDGAEVNVVANTDQAIASASAVLRWDLKASSKGIALALISEAGATSIRLFCPTGQNILLVNVPSFKPIGSEERLSFGSGGNVVALVADPRGDAQRGGVSGSGPVPDDLKGLVAGPIAASYGAQHSGPHAAPPADLARPFVSACFEHASAALQAASKPTPSTSPCLVQDGEALRTSLKAVGTEPFWAARIEGRCVTYSHPEVQKGTRVWTRYTPGPVGGTWAGALGGQPFQLRINPTRKCSDGMSDKVYPITVELTVHGEQRHGCAEPAAK